MVNSFAVTSHSSIIVWVANVSSLTLFSNSQGSNWRISAISKNSIISSLRSPLSYFDTKDCGRFSACANCHQTRNKNPSTNPLPASDEGAKMYLIWLQIAVIASDTYDELEMGFLLGFILLFTLFFTLCQERYMIFDKCVTDLVGYN